MPSTTELPLQDLLDALEAAVLGGYREQALELAQAILRRIASEGTALERAEVRVRTLLLALDLPAPEEEPTMAFSFGGQASADPGIVYPVWYGTNRKPAAGAGAFTHERHTGMTLGRVLVHIPDAHRLGETGSRWWTRMRRFDLRDDRLRVQRVETRDRAAFFAELQSAMQDVRDDGEAPHALLYVHGFDNSFEDAAIRAAQIGFDLQVPGATAFFSWPSRGSVTGYAADGAAIEASEAALTQFIVDFVGHCGAEKVHVIAHSMGNRGFLRALQRIAANAETRGKVKFGQFFLAAPDVDRDLFLDLARLYAEHGERTTLYASNSDLAVHLSARVHSAPRAGYHAPYTLAPGLDTIVVPDFNIDLLGHSYFASAEKIISDIRGLMRHDASPDERVHLDPAEDAGTRFWRFRR